MEIIQISVESTRSKNYQSEKVMLTATLTHTENKEEAVKKLQLQANKFATEALQMLL